MYVLVPYKTRFNHYTNETTFLILTDGIQDYSYANKISLWPHFYNFSPLCVHWWHTKLTFWARLITFLTFKWLLPNMHFLMRCKFTVKKKTLSQWLHLSGLSPLCVLWWYVSLLLRTKVFITMITSKWLLLIVYSLIT